MVYSSVEINVKAATFWVISL